MFDHQTNAERDPLADVSIFSQRIHSRPKKGKLPSCTTLTLRTIIHGQRKRKNSHERRHLVMNEMYNTYCVLRPAKETPRDLTLPEPYESLAPCRPPRTAALLSWFVCLFLFVSSILDGVLSLTSLLCYQMFLSSLLCTNVSKKIQ